MSVRYHLHATLAAAKAHRDQLRARGVLCHVVSMNAEHHEVVELYARDAAPSAVDAYIGSLADATLEPMTDKPAMPDSRVTFGDDPWSRTYAR